MAYEIDEIKVTYNDSGNHEACASREIDGHDCWANCNGLSGCGEADYNESGNPFEEYEDEDSDERDERWEAYQEMKGEALALVKKEWNYDGSNWSEPIDEPDVELVDEADEDHRVAIVRTAFHNGGVIGYAESEEDAGKWIDHAKQHTTCICGCYCVVDADEVDDLPSHTDSRSPYSAAL